MDGLLGWPMRFIETALAKFPSPLFIWVFLTCLGLVDIWTLVHYLAMLTGLAVEMSVVGIWSMARLQRTLMSVMSWPCSLHQSAASLHAFLEKGSVCFLLF